MPIPLEIRKRWIEERCVDELDRPIEVREWMVEHILKPLDGYHAWARNEDRICDDCRALHGEIFMSRKECRRKAHKDCDGLEGHKILSVLGNLKTQQGKTTTAAVYSLSELALALNCGIFYVGSAEDQAKGTFDQKWGAMIRKNPKMKKRLRVLGKSIRNTKKGNTFKFIATSLKSAPGGTYRLVIVDEATKVPNAVIAKLVSRVTAVHGFECPSGHFTCAIARAPKSGKCPLCREELEEFFGRILLLSSSDEPIGAFFEMIEEQKANPDPSVHVYQSSETLNPNSSVEAIEGLSRSWGRLPSMKGLIAREFGVEFTREGEEFLPRASLTAVLSKQLMNVVASDLPCVGFLDCSRTTDLMSLVLGMDVGGGRPFTKIRGDRVDVFDPQDRKQFPRGRVRYLPDPEHPGTSIREHLVSLFGGWVDLELRDKKASQGNNFPGLLEFHIDVTRWEEARDLYEWAREQPWGNRARKYEGNKHEKTLMWELLEERFLAGPRAIEMPWSKRLEKELINASVKMGDNGISKVVVDSPDGDRRRQKHRDISMSIAGVCLVAAKLFARAGMVGAGAVMDRLNASVEKSKKFGTAVEEDDRNVILNKRW